jgi:beta-glucosidase
MSVQDARAEALGHLRGARLIDPRLAPFPSGFTWGVSTSAPQIEGAAHDDGRGDSIWDVFARRHGGVEDGSTPETAVDHYHRMEEDVQLLARLGVSAYRFSVAWPRIFPDGEGEVNERGLAFYDRLVDNLVSVGIEPWACLYHWDLPQALERRGGWSWRGLVPAFERYALTVGSRLGDRVKTWIVLNEANTFTFQGYLRGAHAPGHRSFRRFARAVHVSNLAQAAGARALRACGAERVGTAISSVPVYPQTPAKRDVKMASMLDCLGRWMFLDPNLKGEYPRRAHPLMTLAGVRPGDMALIHEPMDFIGANIYRPLFVHREWWKLVSGRETAPAGVERTDQGWVVMPRVVRDCLVGLHREYRTPLVVTENGAAYLDVPGPDGEVDDRPRWDYLARHIAEARLAIHDGVPLSGYFVWSLLDNFEWAEGYKQRFGIVYVDRSVQRRVLKTSAKEYADVVSVNGLREKDLARRHPASA